MLGRVPTKDGSGIQLIEQSGFEYWLAFWTRYFSHTASLHPGELTSDMGLPGNKNTGSNL